MSRYIPKKQLVNIRKISAYDYLTNYNPDILTHISKDVYCTKDHDSLHISPRGWSWWSKGIKGFSAIDYFVCVEGYSFLDACHIIMDTIKTTPMIVHESDKSISKNTFTLPEKDDNNFEVFRYLCKERKIDKDVVAYFISKEQIYQDKKFHNVVFVGYDGTRPAYAFKRSITGNFKQDASGSDKAYSFSFKNPESDTLHVFEAAIDLLSYMSLLRMNHIDFRKDNCLSLAGATNAEVLPMALKVFLSDNKNIKTIQFHLDNDIVGIESTEKMMNVLSGTYNCINKPPRYGKDVNEELQICSLKSSKNIMVK